MNKRDDTGSGETTDYAVAPDRLAAFLDGRLTEQERAEIVSQLSRSPADAGLLADTAAVLQEVDVHEFTPSTGTRRVREPAAPTAWGSKRRWIGVAAAIVVVAGASWFVMQRTTTDDAGPARYVAMLATSERLPAGWNGQPWSATRSTTDGPMSSRARAVRLGARLVDLQVAANTADSVVATIASDIARLLSAMPAAAVISNRYSEISRRAGESSASLQPALDEAGSAVRLAAGADDVDLGSWLEAGRLAAIRGDASYFSSTWSRRHFDRLATAADLPAETKTTAERVRSTVVSRSPAWSRVNADLTTVLGEVASGS